ncbi:bifunctional adenosylcobinamide kinase/adenosylcobinamide-phosphate guanylyltransferase [Candidatus Nitrospira neomarina]|uniref:Adenosylcobinamide kinase n=1 Tax=Candidatus Nitrospira neomarina TaxID=3020899 RepID=A0AA96GKL6_9BACT|nr:bifunctional adenosylcobinamide kinase/adenosylcobinamide-phosphate guanylyltransferase [Candidatus Nitrospira neomarina]WNM62732.1 bifunctional adenosylcobinamide kinase/adenosylcobinamide-phosphate guanylyltransferase [Candidatus Nitrospira neomarina]
MRSVRQSHQRSGGDSLSSPVAVSGPRLAQKQTHVPSKLIFVLGGARSGKSSFALQQGKVKSPRAFVATGEPIDQEMAGRIQKHQRSRGRGWVTIEMPTGISEWLAEQGSGYPSIVVDCLTLWLNNLLRNKVRPSQVPTYVRAFLRSARACPGQIVVVSNELGLGLVPGDAISRSFRDVAGRMNQLVAAEADEVYFLVSGLPLRLK